MINVVVEGASDTEVARAVVEAAGRQVLRIVVAGGKGKLDPRIPNYNRAAVQYPWVIFRDSDSSCPVELRSRLTAGMGGMNPQFCLRIAHSMSEAWLLADREMFAEFFGVAVSRIPPNPEILEHAKRTVLALCSQSRSRTIRSDMTTSRQQTGPLYVARINEFASTRWRPLEAANSSESLRRAISGIAQLPES